MKEGDIEFLKQILDYEQSVDMEEIGKLGWCWRDVRVSPGVLSRLFLEGLLENPFKSNSYCGYALSEQGRALALAAVQDEAESGTGSVPNDTDVVLPEDLFGEIIGHEDVKEILRAVISSEKPVHVLLAGPPALAKTLFLWDIERAAGERALWLVGSGTSKAGLWDMVAERQPRILLIDELDKMNAADTAALLSLMEGGRLVRAKVGRQMSTTVPVWVVAATNNVPKLSRELLSRFAVMRIKTYSQVDYHQVVKGVLVQREGVAEDISEDIAMRLDGKSQDVRDAIRVARLVPQLGVEKAIRLLLGG